MTEWSDQTLSFIYKAITIFTSAAFVKLKLPVMTVSLSIIVSIPLNSESSVAALANSPEVSGVQVCTFLKYTYIVLNSMIPYPSRSLISMKVSSQKKKAAHEPLIREVATHYANPLSKILSEGVRTQLITLYFLRCHGLHYSRLAFFPSLCLYMFLSA